MRRRRLPLIVGILALATFLRLYHFASAPPGLYHDEAMNGNNCLENLETGRLSVFYPENGGREGLYVNVATPFVHFLGNTAWALRLPAALFGIATVWGVCLVGRELFSPPIGLLASFFTAPLFLTLGLCLLFVGLRRAFDGRSPIPTMLVAGFVYALGFHTYIAYRATPVLAGAVLLQGFLRLRRQGRTQAFWAACVPFCAAAGVVSAPLALYFLRHPGTFMERSWQVSVAHSPNPFWEVLLNTWRTARMFFTRGDLNWRHNYAYRAEIFWPVAILFALGVLVATVSARNGRESRFPYVLMLIWMPVAALPAVFSDDVLPHALRSILLIPPAFILAAVGAHRAYRFLLAWVPGAILTPLAIGLLLLLAYEPYHTYFDRWAPDARVAVAMESKEAIVAQQINALPSEAPKVVALRTAGALQNGVPVEALPIQYLTRSYTKRQQEDTDIRYVSPHSFTPQPSVDFCGYWQRHKAA